MHALRIISNIMWLLLRTNTLLNQLIIQNIGTKIYFDMNNMCSLQLNTKSIYTLHLPSDATRVLIGNTLKYISGFLIFS